MKKYLIPLVLLLLMLPVSVFAYDCYDEGYDDHAWIPISTYQSYDTYDHWSVTKYQCTRCGETKEEEGDRYSHTMGYNRSGKTIICRCSGCDYVEGRKKKTYNSKKTFKRKKLHWLNPAAFSDDDIKSIKVLSGKKRLAMARAFNSIAVIGKRKGKAKIRITMKSGIVHNYTIRIK